MSWTGHLWTLGPSVVHRLRPEQAPAAQPWSTTVDGGCARAVRLTGALRERESSDTLVVVVHGLGGALDSHYCVRAAHAIDDAGWSSLRLALRGADRAGEDFYHAGLEADLAAAFASPELARYTRLFVLGYSLGGHVSLHAAVRRVDARLAGVAAVCAPLDLDKSATAIDRRGLWVYRNHILSGLKDIYAAVAARHPVPTPLSRIMQVKHIREWDTLTVVPHYGFASVDDYYARMSVGPQLHKLQCPTLLLPSRHDPMVPPWAFEAHLAAASPQLTVRWIDAGGHVGFPEHVGLERQAMQWFAQQGSA